MTISRTLMVIGYALFGAAGLKGLGIPVPLALLTGLGVLALAASKFLRAPRPLEAPGFSLPESPESLEVLLERGLPSIMSWIREADASLSEHQRFEGRVGGGSAPAFIHWLLSGLRAAVYWVPVSLLAMLAGAAAISPLKLVSGGLGLARTEAGQWILRQSWPLLVAKVTAIEVLGQAYALAGFIGLRALFQRLGFKDRNPEFASAAVVAACYLSFLLVHGFALMQASPLTGIQLALLYAYCRTRTLLVPAAANVALGLASLYSARMVVLLAADLGSLDALPGIPGAPGVLAVLGLSLGLFLALAAWRSFLKEGWGFVAAEVSGQWQRLRSLGTSWSEPADLPGTPLALMPAGLLWGIGIYLASYLSYYAAHLIVPSHEVVPPILKQTLLMPFDMLVYVFVIGAGLEELIFRKGLFKALLPADASGSSRLRIWSAALVSAAVFSAFHFIDFGVVLGFLGIDASRLIRSLLVVYGFSWAGFIGRVSAGLVLAMLYERSGILLIPIIAHFTSNMLEAVGLRWGLPWFLAAVSGIFLIQLLEKKRLPSPGDALGGRP